MVSKTDEEQVNQLENQVDNGGGGAWEYLSLVRKLKIRRSDKVLKHGLSILNDSNKRSALGADGTGFILYLFLNNCSVIYGIDLNSVSGNLCWVVWVFLIVFGFCLVIDFIG